MSGEESSLEVSGCIEGLGKLRSERLLFVNKRCLCANDDLELCDVSYGRSIAFTK